MCRKIVGNNMSFTALGLAGGDLAEEGYKFRARVMCDRRSPTDE